MLKIKTKGLEMGKALDKFSKEKKKEKKPSRTGVLAGAAAGSAYGAWNAGDTGKGISGAKEYFKRNLKHQVKVTPLLMAAGYVADRARDKHNSSKQEK
jgi:hypothetical protein